MLTYSTMISLLPNLVSVIRMCSAPVIILLILSQQWYWAWWLFFGAALSDLADGVIARYLRAVSTLGRWLDPLADKVLIFSLVLFLAMVGKFPIWLAVLIFARDAVLGVGIAIRRARRLPDMRVLILGKIHIAAQYVLIGLILGVNVWKDGVFEMMLAEMVLARDLMIITVALFTIGSALAYGIEAFASRRRR